MKGLTLSTREQSRIQVLNKMIGKEVPVADAAGLMGVSSAMRGDYWRRIERRELPP